jgi:hypothetical protein
MTLLPAPRDWKPMASVPVNGNWFDVLCVSKDGVVVVVEKVRYQTSRSKGSELRGSTNLLSTYLDPKGWDHCKAT